MKPHGNSKVLARANTRFRNESSDERKVEEETEPGLENEGAKWLYV